MTPANSGSCNKLETANEKHVVLLKNHLKTIFLSCYNLSLPAPEVGHVS